MKPIIISNTSSATDLNNLQTHVQDSIARASHLATRRQLNLTLSMTISQRLLPSLCVQPASMPCRVWVESLAAQGIHVQLGFSQTAALHQLTIY